MIFKCNCKKDITLNDQNLPVTFQCSICKEKYMIYKGEYRNYSNAIIVTNENKEHIVVNGIGLHNRIRRGLK